MTANGAKKPAWTAFRSVADANGGAPIACGDLDAPTIDVVSPVEGQQFVDRIDVRASAKDNGGVGLVRIGFSYDGGKSLGSFTKDLKEGVIVGLEPWYGSSSLTVGPHKIEITAVDSNGNKATKVIDVVKATAGSLAATLKGTFTLPKTVTCKSGTCTLAGRFPKLAGQPAPTGKVTAEWQFKNKKGKYVTLHRGSSTAARPFRFRLKPTLKGLWRVRVVYQGVAPYKKVTSKYVASGCAEALRPAGGVHWRGHAPDRRPL